MTVNNSVNQNPNRTGLYTMAGTLAGGGIGAGSAYLLKPYLKNGEPKDVFLNSIRNNIDNNTREKLIQLTKINDTESLINFIGKDKFEKYSDIAQNAIKNKDINLAKDSVGNILILENRMVDCKKLYKDFKENTKNLTQDELSAVKKALRNTKSRYALLLGGIGAFILGLGAFLISNRNKD